MLSKGGTGRLRATEVSAKKSRPADREDAETVQVAVAQDVVDREPKKAQPVTAPVGKKHPPRRQRRQKASAKTVHEVAAIQVAVNALSVLHARPARRAPPALISPNPFSSRTKGDSLTISSIVWKVGKTLANRVHAVMKPVIGRMIGTLRRRRRSRSTIWWLTTPGRKNHQRRGVVVLVADVGEVVVPPRIVPLRV